MQSKQHLKQPKSFFLLCFTEVWERFGYYILAYLLVLYTEQHFGFTDSQAFTLFGVFSGLVVITPAIGGYLGDHVFGIKRSLMLGLFLLACGYIMLALPYDHLFYPALGVLIVGNGFFKISPSNLLARSYKREDPRIDSGFTLFYISINIGSFCATLVAGILSQLFGWKAAFLAAGIGLIIGLLGFIKFKHVVKKVGSKPGMKSLPWTIYAKVCIGSVVAAYICMLLVKHGELANAIFIGAFVLICCYFLYEILKSNSEDRQRIIVCIVLMLMGMTFFTLYFQAYTSINLFINRNVDRHIFGYLIPTPIFQSLNPFWILALGPVLATLYNRFNRRGKDLFITTKFCLGIVIISLCFFSLKAATMINAHSGTVSFWWIVWGYFLYSFGELLISALGMAMVTKIAPFRMFGVMMGAWYFFSAMGAALAAHFADLAKIPKSITDPVQMLPIYGHAFFVIGMAGVGCAVVSIAISPFIKRLILKNNA